MDNEVYQRRILIILRADAQDLFRRLDVHLRESVSILNLKRTREHFRDLFKSRFHTFTAGELKLIDEATIVAVTEFYREIDELHWFLTHTQDQPQMILDRCEKALKIVRTHFDTLILHLEAELDQGENLVESQRDEDSSIHLKSDAEFDILSE